MRKDPFTVIVLMDSSEEKAFVLKISLLVSRCSSKMPSIVNSLSELLVESLSLCILSWAREGAV